MVRIRDGESATGMLLAELTRVDSSWHGNETWRELVDALRPHADSRDPAPGSARLQALVDDMPADAADFLEAVCRSVRLVPVPGPMLARAFAKVRQQEGTNYRSLRQVLTRGDDGKRREDPSCAIIDEARLRLAEAARLREWSDDPNALTRGQALANLRDEVAVALPDSLELANLDEYIADGVDRGIMEARDLLIIRDRTLGAKHPDVIAARLAAARKWPDESQYLRVIADAAPGSTYRLLALTELFLLRTRLHGDVVELRSSILTDLANPIADRDSRVFGVLASTLALTFRAQRRAPAVYAVVTALLAAYTTTPYDACDDSMCDARQDQLDGLRRIEEVLPAKLPSLSLRIADLASQL